MLSRKRRLNTRLFEEVMIKGKVYHSPHLLFRLFFFNNDLPSKFAIAASKKVEKTAVKRNLIKRRCSELVYKHLKNIKNGYGGIFFAKKGILDSDTATLEQEIMSLLQTLNSGTIH